MNDDRRAFPGAVYGKRGGSGAVHSGYEWLYVDEGFPQETAGRFVKGVFQWLDGPGRYPPVMVWIPNAEETGGGFLIRFMDAGLDDGNRPHTLLADFALITSDDIEREPGLPLALLCGPAPAEPALPAARPVWSAGGTEAIDKLTGALNREGIDWRKSCIALASRDSNFRYKPPCVLNILHADDIGLSGLRTSERSAASQMPNPQK